MLISQFSNLLYGTYYMWLSVGARNPVFSAVWSIGVCITLNTAALMLVVASVGGWDLEPTSLMASVVLPIVISFPADKHLLQWHAAGLRHGPVRQKRLRRAAIVYSAATLIICPAAILI